MCHKWLMPHRTTGLQVPLPVGRRRLGPEQYEAMFADLLAWGTELCRRRRDAGLSTHFRDFVDLAVEESDYRHEVISRLMTVESQDDGAMRLAELLKFRHERDEEEKDAEFGCARVMWRMKRLLGNLGFAWRPIVRESVKTMSEKLPWSIRFAKWYMEYASQPCPHSFLYWLDESFAYEGEATTGTMVEPKTTALNHVVLQESANWRRIGMLDGLVLFWQHLPTQHGLAIEDVTLLDDAVKDPHNWSVLRHEGQLHVLRCCKLPTGSLVWPSMKAGDEGKAEQKPERVPKQAEEERGTMNWARFELW